jgi:hypothetical protein
MTRFDLRTETRDDTISSDGLLYGGECTEEDQYAREPSPLPSRKGDCIGAGLLVQFFARSPCVRYRTRYSPFSVDVMAANLIPLASSDPVSLL